MENIFGGLLEFQNKEELEDFMSKMDKEGAVKILELCIIHGQNSGFYTITESFCLYNCLKLLKEK